MQDAAVERLAKIIAPEDDPGKNRRLQARNLLAHLRLAEGWFSFFLLALVVYSTIWCVQAVNWVDHLSLLTPITALGLLCGIIAAKQRRIPRLLVHVLAVVLSVLLAFWQTSGADYAGHASAFLGSIRTWFSLALAGGTSSDDSIFLFFILMLGFLLAYTSAWLVYRTRSPWLMLLANAVVLLINLSNIDAGYVIFLVIFLVAALLLLLRFNLYESSIRWKRQGLRCSDDLNWEFMQAGALISLGILVFSWLLPWGYTNQAAAQIWSADNNPWVQAQNIWNRLISVSGGTTPQNHGNFTNLLTLGGSPNLTNTLVFHVKTNDGSQYLQYASYDQYDGSRNWLSGALVTTPNRANTVFYDGSIDLRSVTQTVQVVNAPGEQFAYLFGAPQIAQTDQGAQLVRNKTDGETVAWLRDNGKLAAGNVYTVVSYVSDADIDTLRTVPMPDPATQLPPGFDGQVPPTYFDPAVLATYTKLPPGLNPAIKQLALQITAHASTMYDKVAALETYLRSTYQYDASITAPPPGAESVSWFLFQSKRGFCNYFAGAMALMARELGIPARVAAGYTNGKYNPKTNQWDVVGTDAHAWTQVYFAGYGWINFEPSATFSAFARPLKANGTPGTSVAPGGSNGSNGRNNHQNLPQESGSTGFDQAGGNASGAGDQIRTDVGIVLLALVIFIFAGLIYFTFWWRRLFRGLSLPSQIYGRVGVLAAWAGIPGKRSQTPHEYMLTVSSVAPEEAVSFERLGDIYARERWADPQSPEHPNRSGETAELPGLWKALQRTLALYVLRHPHFLREIPARLGGISRRLFSWRGRRGISTVVVEEDLEKGLPE
jgi:transglutaminase-like putative cysteine protease